MVGFVYLEASFGQRKPDAPKYANFFTFSIRLCMLRLTPKAGFLLVFILCSSGLFLRFGPFFSFEKGMVIEAYGDGFKAYMSPAWHALYDTSWSHFEGMHYPYGDHLVMSDPQPLVANAIKAVGPPGEARIQTVINWTHLAMLGSILLSALFLYLLFERLQLPIWFAVGASVALSFLAPMVARMGFHFGLAQPAALSVVLYLVLRFQERPAWKWSLFIAAAVIFFSLFHFHYFGLLVLGLSLYFLVDALLGATRQSVWTLLAHYAVQVLVPFVLLYSWINVGISVADRASQPWGFLYYRARLEGLFTSLDQPHWRWFSKWVSPLPPLDVEAVNYIGLVAGVFTVLVVFIQLRSGFRKAIFPLEMPGRAFLLRLFLSAVLLLFFALGLPFIISPLHELLRYLGPLQQFRALGRFSWYFFYAANISGLAWFAYLWRSKPWLLCLPLGILGLEAWFFIQSRDVGLDSVPGLAAEESVMQRAIQQPSDYQAIFTIPFFHLGSESFWLEPYGALQQEAMVLALRSGLPLQNAMLSRTSLGQTLRQLQMVSEPYREPAIRADFPNERPLLLLYDREEAARQAPRWSHFTHNLDTFGMELVFVQGTVNYYNVPLDYFSKNLQHRREQVVMEIEGASLIPNGKYKVSPRLAPFVVHSFDEESSRHPYQGRGGFEGEGKKENLLYTWQIPEQSAGVAHTISYWFFVQADLQSRGTCVLRERNPNGTVAQEQSAELHRHWTVFDTNGWVLLEFPFRPQQAGNQLEIVLKNDLIGRRPIFADELLIRPADMSVFASNSRWLWKNNRFYPQQVAR